MKRIIFSMLLFVLFSASILSAQPVQQQDHEAILKGLGFAFQGKDFKTVKIALFSIKEKDSDGAIASEGHSISQDSGNQQLKGKLVIGGYDYILRVTNYAAINIEADLFSEDTRTSATDNGELKLPVPLGHVSLNLSEPDPGCPVITGSLRLKDEKVTSVSGEFELYLNDMTRAGKKNRKDQSSDSDSGMQ
ncbi:MAG TPA: hypothetical protein PLK28_01790 [Candidatus Rifleibacterium sp.]|nr:hypothetical protein [Candidatus Rifleibacterium sp.]